MAAGTDASSTLAPAAERASAASPTRAVTSASIPSISSRTTPTRSPSTPSRRPVSRSGAGGVARGTEGGVLGGAAHGDLVEVGLADHDAARRSEPGDGGGVVRWPPVAEDLGRAGRPHAPRAHVVLQGHGDAGQPPRVL